MTLSLNLVLALFLLAPGFAAYAGIYFGSQLGSIKSPPPPSNSVMTLAVITIGALSGHLFCAGYFTLQDQLCNHSQFCMIISFDPNAYGIMLNAVIHSYITPGLLFYVLCVITAITILNILIISACVTMASNHDWYVGLTYGWLAEVGVARGPNEAILAYVLSDVKNDGTIVGYEGVATNILVSQDKEISALTLKDCEMFYLRVTKSGVFRHRVPKSTPIPILHLDKGKIQNVAFERLIFEVAEGA